MESWLLRTKYLLGEEALVRLQSMRVMICGVGGVGGMALEVLVRSGVGSFVLIDCDVFHPTNLNRQILATSLVIGKAKVMVAEQRVKEINPKAEVFPLHAFVDASVEKIIREYDPDFVIDAIDSLNPKVQLISTLVRMGKPFVSSMGAAARFDATAFRRGTLDEVKGCPLARKVKQRLRRLGVAVERVPVVYSKELVYQGQGIGERVYEPNAYDRGRERIPRGSLATTVMVAGLLCAESAIVWGVERGGSVFVSAVERNVDL